MKTLFEIAFLWMHLHKNSLLFLILSYKRFSLNSSHKILLHFEFHHRIIACESLNPLPYNNCMMNRLPKTFLKGDSCAPLQSRVVGFLFPVPS
jgi:hypothetical protein